MNKIIYIFGVVAVISCNNKSYDTDSSSATEQSQSIVVNDTIHKKLNQGQQLLAKAREKLWHQKDQKFEIKVSENKMMAQLLLKYRGSKKFTEKELEAFLLIDPSDLENSAELSQMYNTALFNVILNNNKSFVNQLVMHPTLSQKLSDELSNPVNDNIQSDHILKSARDEYQIQIDNRINEIVNERLIMQYYIEKQRVFKELDGEEIDMRIPQKIQKLDQTRIINFEREYKIESRIPDEGVELTPGGLGSSVQSVGNTVIKLEDVQVDLRKLRLETQLEEAINKEQLKELQKVENLQDN